MEPRPQSAIQELPGPAGLGTSPFLGPGLLARALPFALVAVAAEASLALPPRTGDWAGVTVSLVLLAAVGLAFLLPWDRLPAWTSVLVPLAYTGSALALTLAAGTISDVGAVLLIPLIWTVLFRRRWESACVLAAIVTAEIVISVVQSAPGVVAVRGALLWGALGALLAVATHGLRDRIRRSQREAARLQERVGELMVVHDRDRLAAGLQSSVVQRIFAAGLGLQGALSLITQAEARRRVESAVTELDDAIRLLRQVIFGLENRLATEGLRQQVLHLCADLSPVPEITFAGPVDEALSAEAASRLLDMLRRAVALVGTGPAAVCVEAGESLGVSVTGTGAAAGNGHRAGPGFAALRERAGQAGVTIGIEQAAGGTTLAWSVPLKAEPAAG